jgi:hypothetical protein
MNNKILLLSSLTFLVPSYIYYNFSHPNSNKFIIILLNRITTLTSLLFWYSGKENSFFHKLDAKWMRIVVLYGVISILKKTPTNMEKILLVILCILCFITLLYSDYFSNILWCSYKHITTHLILHIFFSITNSLYILL